MSSFKMACARSSCGGDGEDVEGEMFTHLTEGHNPFLLVQEPRRDGEDEKQEEQGDIFTIFTHTERHTDTLYRRQ